MRHPYKKDYKNLHWPSGIGVQQKAPQYYSIFLCREKTGTSFFML